jgi:hypothetical protein
MAHDAQQTLAAARAEMFEFFAKNFVNKAVHLSDVTNQTHQDKLRQLWSILVCRIFKLLAIR